MGDITSIKRQGWILTRQVLARTRTQTSVERTILGDVVAMEQIVLQLDGNAVLYKMEKEIGAYNDNLTLDGVRMQ